MASPNIRTVRKQSDAWESVYYDNNQRGKSAIDFALCGEQWTNSVLSQRQIDNKESLVFNLELKHLKRLKRQIRELEFSLNVKPANTEVQKNVEENNAFNLLLRSILLNDEMLSKFEEAGDKCATFGYSFAEVNYRPENQDSLNLIPILRVHKDPGIAFWDINAPHPTKVDGRFCGMKRSISKEDFLQKYPQYKNDSDWLKKDNNVFIDYWYRDYEDVNFVLLKNGSYKCEIYLTLQDRENLATEEDAMDFALAIGDKVKPKPLIVKGRKSCIYHKRFCNERVVQKAMKFPTQDLPLVYHFGFTVWKKDFGDQTYPFTFHLDGAQKLHNYLLSQVATVAKNSTDPVWFTQPENVQTKTQINAWTNINKIGGAIVVNDIQKIRKELPTELPGSMLEGSQLVKQEIDEIAGANIDSQNSDSLVLSRVALDKITHNIDVNNVDFTEAHILFVNQIGRLFRQMLPEIVTEERTIVVQNSDSSYEAIVINQDLGTGTLKNNIRDINTNYDYEIVAGPSTTMIKENTLKYLNEAFSINPQLFQVMGDIWARNLDIPDAGEMEARISATMIDPDLIKFSQGKMSKEDYQQSQQQKQQQQMQQQMQQMMMSPEFQSMMTAAQAEQNKAMAQQFEAQTNRLETMSQIQAKNQELMIKLLDVVSKNEREIRQQDIDTVRDNLKAAQESIDVQKASNEEPNVVS